MKPVLFALAFVTGACRLPNEDHCVHKSAHGDAWCAELDPALPYCSPCAEESHGCVAAAPDAEECPEYEADTTGETGGTTTGG